MAICLNTNAQNINGKVVYDCLWTVSYPLKAEGTLCFTPSSSYFVASSPFAGLAENASEEPNGNVVQDMGNGSKIIQGQRGELLVKRNKHRSPEVYCKTINDPFNILTTLTSQKLYQRLKDERFKPEERESAEFYLEEQTGSIQWQLHNEYREVGKFRCQRATCRFRGRDYTAWFSTEIPVSYGPWKLNGLPGLILEAYDSKQEVLFTAKDVKISNKTECDIPELSGMLPVYQLKEYVYFITHRNAMQLKQQKENQQRISARMPEDSRMEVSNARFSFRGLQLEYEF